MQTIYYIDRYGNIDRTGFRYKKTPTVKIYPVTLVNLVGGIASSFEYDSDGNGLADGWTSYLGSNSLVSGVIGNNAQQIEYDNTSGSSTKYPNVSCVRYHPIRKFFASVYVKKTTDDTSTNNPRLVIKLLDSSNAWVDSLYVYSSGNTSWERICNKKESTESVDHFSVILDEPTEAGAYASFVFDAVAVYDLEAMGTLPPPLQELYSATYWYELSEEQLAALLPFCPGVCSLGFAWESDV